MADPDFPPNTELHARIGADLERRFGWPTALAPLTKPMQNLSAVMDLDRLAGLAARVHDNNELAFAIISREYLQTGLNWIYAMQRIGLKNFLIISGDKTTVRELTARNIESVLAEIDEVNLDPTFVSATGFSAKGLAVSAFKFPVARFLLRLGYSVVLSDADAVWLRDPMTYLRGADLAFQRIAYHPPPISRLWGFAACGGFLSLRNGARALAFTDRCIEANRRVFSDQVALNYCLLEGEPQWQSEGADWVLPADDAARERSAIEAAFVKTAKHPISGKLRRGGLEILALPHDKFWRHEIVTCSLTDTVICHPNSPKDDTEKMKIFGAMGLRFDPGIIAGVDALPH